MYFTHSEDLNELTGQVLKKKPGASRNIKKIKGSQENNFINGVTRLDNQCTPLSRELHSSDRFDRL